MGYSILVTVSTAMALLRGPLAALASLVMACTPSADIGRTEVTAPSTSSAPPLAKLYSPIPIITATLGNFATGVALADLDRDGWLDLVTSNGNDVSPQTVTVYANTQSQTTPFESGQYPSWYSGDVAFHAGLSVGDVDGDGWLDVAVAVPMSNFCDIELGGVVLYMNRHGTLEDRPSWRSEDGYGATDVAFTDVNGDGSLDLAVAVIEEGDGAEERTKCPRPDVFTGGHQRIYLNHGGMLERRPTWKSKHKLEAAGIVAADIDQDGWMDLSFAATQATIFHGRASGDHLPLDEAGWTSEEKHIASAAIDAAWLDGRTEGPLGLAIASNCLMASPCSSDVFLYEPSKGTKGYKVPVQLQNASRLLLADLNADSYMDLVLTQVGEGLGGAPILFFQGPLAEQTAPVFTTLTSVLGQSIAAGDTRRRALREEERTFETRASRAVLTLPERRVQAIRSVERLLPIGTRAPARYAWVPGSNWIALAEPLSPGERARVRYEVSSILDIAAAVATTTSGSYVLYSKYR